MNMGSFAGYGKYMVEDDKRKYKAWREHTH